MVIIETAQGDSSLATLKDIPLIVLSCGLINPGLPDEQFEQQKRSWYKSQRELAGLSSNSRHITAEESGLNIHQDQPELMVDAIQQLVGRN